MSVYFTRARHPELPSVVMPVEAVEHYAGWVAYGDPSVDLDALNVELLLESRAGNPDYATPEPAPEADTPAEPPAAASKTAKTAPAGADPKEQ